MPLDVAVRDRVEAETGRRPTGPVRMLTLLRTFGHCFNPVSFYYCYDAAGAAIEAVVAEITNTPWGERHAYVLPASAGTRDERRPALPLRQAASTSRRSCRWTRSTTGRSASRATPRASAW